MADTIASLAIEVDAGPAAAAAKSLDALAAAAQRTEQATAGTASAHGRASVSLQDLARAGGLTASVQQQLAQVLGSAATAGNQAAAANQNLANTATQAAGATARAAQGIQQAGQQAAQAQANVTNLGRGLQALGGFAGGFGGGGFGGFLSVFTGGLAARGIEEAAEAVGRLTRATVEDGEAWVLAGQRLQFTLGLTRQQADEARAALAQGSQGVRLQDTFQLAARIGPSLKERGFDVPQIETIITTLNRLATVSGTTGQQASRAFYQLSQAFALGKLQGQDLRILIEDMPPLFTALAEATGKTQGELLAMAHAGELTSSVLGQALLGAAGKVGEQFEQMGQTVSRGLTDVQNAFTESAGRAAEATGSIQQVGGALEELATFIRGPVFTGAMTAVNAILADVAHAAQFAASGVNAGVREVQSLASTQQPSPADLFARAREAQSAAEEQRQGAEELARRAAVAGPPPDQGPASARISRDLGQGSAIVREAQAAAARAEAAEAEAQRAMAEFVASQTRAAGTGTAGNPANIPPDPAVLAANQKLVDSAQKRVTLQEQLNNLARDESVLRASGKFTEQEITNYDALKRAEIERTQEAQRHLEVENAYAKAQGITLAQAQRELGLNNDATQGLNDRARVQARINELQRQQSFFRSPGNQDAAAEARITQELTQQRQHLAQIDQQRADTLARQREALIGQESPAARLAADEERIARATRASAEGGPALRNQQDVAAAQSGAFQRYANAVAEQAQKETQGQNERIRLQAQISALQQAEVEHGEARLQIEDRLRVARTALATLDAKDTEELNKQAAATDRQLAQSRIQLAQAQGGGDIRAEIEDRVQRARQSVQDLSKELQAAPGGQAEQARRVAARDEIADNERITATLDAQRKAAQLVGDQDADLADKARQLAASLRAGLITRDQATAALERYRVAAQKAAAQQKIQDLVDAGEPNSGVGVLGQVKAGAQAAGLQYIIDNGNVAKATMQGILQETNDVTDAFAQWAVTGKGNIEGLIQSLEQMAIKLTLQIALAKILQAALGGAAAGIGGGAAAGAGYTGATSAYTIYHGGGLAGEAGPTRLASPMLLAAARRYHLGGYPGLDPDEVPAILRRGERVLNRQETAAYDRQGGPASSGEVRVNVNNSHPDVDASASARRNSDGSVDIDLLLERKVAQSISRGRLNKALQSQLDAPRRLY